MDTFLALVTDPVLTRALGATLSVVFLVGAWNKLKDPLVFSGALDNYRLLPERLVPLVAGVLPIVELSAGGLLLFPDTAYFGGVLALLLLLTVTAAVAINVLRGHTRIDCGCGGLSGQPLSWALVVRNLLLMAMVGLAMQDAAVRALVWADYLTVGGAVLALVGLYVSANQLMINAPLALAIRK